MLETIKKMFKKKAILLALCVYVLPYLLAALPKGIMVILLTCVAITLLVGFGTIKEGVLGAYQSSKNLCKRIGKIASMSEDEFSSRFQTASSTASAASREDTAQGIGAPAPMQRGSRIPRCCLEQTIAEERAQTIAQQWWDDGGRDRVEELIQDISASTPQTHTCQLGDYSGQLALPKDKAVLQALTVVMKSAGLCADYNADENFVVFWGQDANGKEAGEQ